MATTAKLTNAELQQLEKAHVFHSWSAQGALAPLAVERAEGVYMLGPRREALPRLLVAAREREHRPPAPEGGGGDQGAGRPALHRRAAARERQARGAGAAWSASSRRATSTWRSSRTAAPRRPRTRCGWRASTPAATRCSRTYRSYHGGTGGSIVLTGDPRRWAAEPGMAGIVHFCGPYLYRSSFNATSPEEECQRALAHLEEILMYEGPHTVAGHHPRADRRHERHPGAAGRLPAGRPRAVHRSTAS